MPEIITNDDAQYAFDIVKTICTEVGPGLPGSSQERERAAIIKKELESHLGAENVVVEEFTLAPGAFLGLYPISALFMLIAALLNISMGRFTGVSPWLTAIAALAFSIISLLLFIFEFILGFEFIDPFFKKKQSVNVIGTLRKPGTKNVKRLLILSGHHDSAPENTWLRFLGYGFFIALSDLLHRTHHHAGDEHHPADGRDHWQCRHRSASEHWDGSCWPIRSCLPSSLQCSSTWEGKTEEPCRARRIISQPALLRWQCAGSW